jgi:small subunit ribosomal protein S9
MSAAWLPRSVRQGCSSLRVKSSRQISTKDRPLALLTQFHCEFSGRSQKRFLSSTSSRHNDDANGQGGRPLDPSKKESVEAKIDSLPYGARIVPVSPSYFTTKPIYTDTLLKLENLVRKYLLLPQVRPGQAPPALWKSQIQWKLDTGEDIGPAKFRKVIKLLQRLNHIEPSMMPSDVSEAIQRFRRRAAESRDKAKVRVLDDYGRALGVGRRKASSASVWLVEGDGEVLINGKPMTKVFGRVHDRESAIWALKATERVDKYNVWALVKGGGSTGQAEALTLGVAKALLVHEPALKPALRRGKSCNFLPVFSVV